MAKEILKTIIIEHGELEQIINNYLENKGFINENWKFEEFDADWDSGYSVTLSRNEVTE